MDYYPQPRPPLYGTSAEEAPPQTQTGAVRIGPPRYPPAPPATGYAPEPGDWLPRYRLYGERGRAPRALLYTVAAAIVYTLLQVALAAMGLAINVAAPVVLVVESATSLVVLAALLTFGGRDYLMAVGLLAVQLALGVAFSQWQSPLLWVTIAVLVYLLWPSRLKKYGWMGVEEIRRNLAQSRRNHPRRRAHTSIERPPGQNPSDRRIRW